MAIASTFKTVMLNDAAEKTRLKGKNLNFLTDLTREQLQSLFEAARMLEPFHKSGLKLMVDKVLCTMFFQPGTRTRFSTETAMLRLGGSVIGESFADDQFLGGQGRISFRHHASRLGICGHHRPAPF